MTVTPYVPWVWRRFPGFFDGSLCMLVSSVCRGRRHASLSAGGHFRSAFGAFRLLPPALSTALWHRLCVPLIDGQDSLDYLVSRSLMRPRQLLRLINYGKGNAINFDRDRIDERDIENGLSTYSTQVAKEIGLEMRDVLPDLPEDLLYVF
jgi:hypothetical protein